jgi:hypothetical protein
MNVTISTEIHTKTTAEVVLCSVNMMPYLDGSVVNGAWVGETLSGTVTMQPSSSGLTLSNPSRNTTGSMIVNGTTVYTNCGYKFKATGGTAGLTYIAEATFATDLGQTRQFGSQIAVVTQPVTS